MGQPEWGIDDYYEAILLDPDHYKYLRAPVPVTDAELGRQGRRVGTQSLTRTFCPDSGLPLIAAKPTRLADPGRVGSILDEDVDLVDYYAAPHVLWSTIQGYFQDIVALARSHAFELKL